MGNIVHEMGCLSEEEPEFLCLVLAMEEKRLEAEIVTRSLEWYDFELEKEASAKSTAGTGQKEGGRIVVEEADVDDAGP